MVTMMMLSRVYKKMLHEFDIIHSQLEYLTLTCAPEWSRRFQLIRRRMFPDG